ncbi:MAG: hypothetical protein AAFY56_23685 [Pseudomonadota bacterium]
MKTENLSKPKFLIENSAELSNILERVADKLRQRYSDPVVVTLADIWVITYCEAGIDRYGHVDPAFAHSEGEVGLYPLPSNIRDWIGPHAPAHDELTSVEENSKIYYEYLGHLKNRAVNTIGSISLYDGLSDKTASDAANARYLAGVVHGYFYAGVYDDNIVPFDYLMNGYTVGTPLDELMGGTLYKHAGTTIVANRARNIEAALERLETEMSS